jgi:hypothetical protein
MEVYRACLNVKLLPSTYRSPPTSLPLRLCALRSVAILVRLKYVQTAQGGVAHGKQSRSHDALAHPDIGPPGHVLLAHVSLLVHHTRHLVM